jgi:hypothetical protein
MEACARTVGGVSPNRARRGCKNFILTATRARTRGSHALVRGSLSPLPSVRSTSYNVPYGVATEKERERERRGGVAHRE